MKASMTAAILFFVLGVSIGRSRFSSSEVYDDADDVTIPGKFRLRSYLPLITPGI